MKEFIYGIEIVNNSLMPVNKGEIIRCKDCKHLKEIDIDNLYVCARIDFGSDGMPSNLSPENDFCSRGERKETEQGDEG